MISHKDQMVYKKAFALAMEIFNLSKSFPKEEQFSLTSQIRRSSRSVCANFSEAFKRRKYKAHFLSKLTDCDAENAETEVWLEFALESGYITREEFNKLEYLQQEIGKLLGYMLLNYQKFLQPSF